MSFHWGWFLRYKLSQPQSIATHPGPAARPLLSLLPPWQSSRAISRPSRTTATIHAAVRPQTPARHTAYPLSPADSGSGRRLSVCYGVSRASYIFSGCITLLPPHPHSPSNVAHTLSPLPRRPTSSSPPRARPPPHPNTRHRSSIARTFPRARVTPHLDQTFPGRAR